jgi:hypothetical protein
MSDCPQWCAGAHTSTDRHVSTDALLVSDAVDYAVGLERDPDDDAGILLTVSTVDHSTALRLDVGAAAWLAEWLTTAVAATEGGPWEVGGDA